MEQGFITSEQFLSKLDIKIDKRAWEKMLFEEQITINGDLVSSVIDKQQLRPGDVVTIAGYITYTLTEEDLC